MMLKILLFITLFFVHTHASQLRIINGTQVDANDSKWEFIVSLQYKNTHYCGGSLIAPQWVLTAAHCWHDRDGNPYALDPLYVKIATNNYRLSQQTLYTIEDKIVHPDYHHATTDNDLALLKLTLPVSGVDPIILDHTSPLTEGLENWVAGWGTMTEGQDDPPDTLMQVMVPHMNFDTCNASYTALGYPLTDNMFCAGYSGGVKDSCQGDSGGPLISDTNGTWLQTGVVSWGEGCARSNYPGVYAKVQNYIPWIESHTGTLPTLTDIKYPFLPVITNYLLD